MSEGDFEKIASMHEELARQVLVTEDSIVINVAYEYDIPISRCNTPEKILSWVHHLTEKTWITPAVLRRFIEVSFRTSNLKMESA